MIKSERVFKELPDKKCLAYTSSSVNSQKFGIILLIQRGQNILFALPSYDSVFHDTNKLFRHEYSILFSFGEIISRNFSLSEKEK